ncbi:DNA polymerase III subunit delta' [Dehalococcoidia bacterium]|nr:DNA polymerase III subunit delta' [Dehalococcoidia bacterium]
MSNWKILGQPHITKALDRIVHQGRLAHAYLIIGPSNIGKTTLALQFAQAVNCMEDDRPCGRCRHCQRIDRGVHADVQMVTLERDERTRRMKEEIGIDQIRALTLTAALTPYEGNYRVIIVCGAERMSTHAANALLKTLEEPPPNVLLLLLTTNEGGIPATIVSRCHRLELRPLPEHVMVPVLKKEYGLSSVDAQLLARISGGRLGWAIGAATNPKILDQRQQRLTTLMDVINGGLERRFQYTQELAQLFSMDKSMAQDILWLWLLWWRDLLLLKERTPELVINLDCMTSLEATAPRIREDEVAMVVRELISTGERIGQNANPRIALDVLMLTIPMMA